MYLSRVKAENFRIFGDAESGTSLDLQLTPGLNLIVGENDSGKSALIDAIRMVLGTRDYEWLRLTKDDFHVSSGGVAKQLRIECHFEGFDEEEASAFPEWLGVRPVSEDNPSSSYFLRIWLEAQRKDESELSGRFDREISVAVKAGPDEDGARMDGEARELLRATYLKPLRDAEQELAARRGSRLSQVLLAHPEMKGQEEDSPDTLVSIMKEANKRIKEHGAIENRVTSLNEDYLTHFTLGDDPIHAAVDIAPPKLRSILERLELSLTDENETEESTRHGLGMNNLLFMATELLLLQSPNAPLPLVLIEEPEAHLHPQFQLRLIEFLEQHAPTGANRSIQVIMTSHSPNLASKVDLEHLIIMHRGQAYPMASQYTLLSKSDYNFLRRFLDVTKANLFFAQGVLIVEGNAEQILLPTLAELIGRPLAKYGVSIVNVGHIGLFRYARIFQRTDGKDMSIRVVCITDLDIPPDAAKEYLKKDKDGNTRSTKGDLQPGEWEEIRRRKSARPGGEPVRTYVSPQWTMEYDIAVAGHALRMHVAIQLAKTSANKPDGLSEEEESKVIRDAASEYCQWKREGRKEDKTEEEIGEETAVRIYRPLYERKASKAEAAQYFAKLLSRIPRRGEEAQAAFRSKLPTYLVEAIDYVTRNDSVSSVAE